MTVCWRKFICYMEQTVTILNSTSYGNQCFARCQQQRFDEEMGETTLRFQLELPPKVELEGVEPSSKQGNHMLSTRLFWTSFS